MKNTTIAKETRTEIQLFEWLINKEVCVYFNRKISLLGNTFTFKTSSKEKPDLILYSRRLNKYIAVEVKSAQEKSDLFDSNKIINYQQDYKNKQTKYYIEGKEIEIAYFIIATENSKEGRLFYESEIVYPNKTFQKVLIETKQEPPREFRRTKDFLRGNIWAAWRNKKTFTREPNDPGIGILTSSFLNNDEWCNPKIQVIEYSNYNKR